MTGNHIGVFGIYASTSDAERGAADLISAEYSNRDISVLLPDLRSAGATAGDLLAGALGILTGPDALAVPGVGPMVAAGPILPGLAGLRQGAAAGGLLGALVGLGIPEYEAKRYVHRVEDGGTLLSVHCEAAARVKRAKQILNSSGAEDVAASNECRSEESALAHA
jgi:hypothetical protein